MAIRYFDGRTDPRECIDITGGTLVHAVMVNDDYSLDRVLIDDLDYQDGRIANAKIDASDETCERVRSALMTGERPYITHESYRGVRVGDIVKVVKGRKYPIGDLITVKDTFKYDLPYDTVDYIVGTEGEKIQAKNCVIVQTRETSYPSEE